MKNQCYQVYVCISGNGPSLTSVQHGYCQCPVGLGQSCSHIGSLLFALSHAKSSPAVKSCTSKESCTSKPCKWVVPTGRPHKPSGPMKTLCHRRSRGNKTNDATREIEDPSFDPDHTSDRVFDPSFTLLQRSKGSVSKYRHEPFVEHS